VSGSRRTRQAKPNDFSIAPRFSVPSADDLARSSPCHKWQGPDAGAYPFFEDVTAPAGVPPG